jgi:hypothetical protein
MFGNFACQLPGPKMAEIKDFDYVNIDELRVRLRNMTDQDLNKFGKAARSLIETKRAIGKLKPNCRSCGTKTGADSEGRTRDLAITNRTLYQLS